MQKTISSLVQLITSRLVQEISVNIQIAWVNDCVKFFVDRDSTYHAGILYENTKEQFLLATLADTSNQVISDAFFSQKTNTEWKTNGRMLLQMQFILEICKLLK